MARAWAVIIVAVIMFAAVAIFAPDLANVIVNCVTQGKCGGR